MREQDELERGAASVTAGAATPVKAENFRVLGHAKLGGKGFDGDVWAHRGFAYVGIWSGPTCPASGVKVVDVREPRQPRMVARLQNPAATSAEDVVVRRVSTPGFSGSLAVVGIQACDWSTGVFRGLQFFDVSKPRRPRLLGRWSSSRVAPAATRSTSRPAARTACLRRVPMPTPSRSAASERLSSSM